MRIVCISSNGDGGSGAIIRIFRSRSQSVILIDKMQPTQKKSTASRVEKRHFSHQKAALLSSKSTASFLRILYITENQKVTKKQPRNVSFFYIWQATAMLDFVFLGLEFHVFVYAETDLYSHKSMRMIHASITLSKVKTHTNNQLSRVKKRRIF